MNTNKSQMPVVMAELDVDVIIGMDFIKNHDLSIDIKSNKMTVQGQTIPLNYTGSTGCYRIVLAEEIDVPPMSEVIVKGSISQPGIKIYQQGLVEPSESFAKLGQRIVGRSLVTVDECVPVRMANCHPKFRRCIKVSM
ncbi:hypothetical protein DPMN_042678 [Dreissena polymorpha]|uniref:Uncharacterized protein n=1 Tax=Dreissena polymorpha TaxID=45954 RepID=A0A9D4D1E4_DREPO|nr:hypothetical protein DPMN_042678 [Dreissena polymorpha]